jgi:predicted metal-dependent phosphoesterase TrpH
MDREHIGQLGDIESRHNHTVLSDGVLTHKELFYLTQKAGFSVLAFTDHDSLPDEETLRQLEELRSEPMKWIMGIEMTARLPDEYSGTPFHLVGLFVDPRDSTLLSHCASLQTERIERMHKLLAHVHALGFEVSVEDVLEEAQGDSVGMPHIAKAIERYPKNKVVVEEIEKKLAIAKEIEPHAKEIYQRLQIQGERGKPYLLYLSRNSFIPPPHIELTLPSIDEASAMIRNAGGVSILAHYFTYSRQLPMHGLREILDAKRIDGVETVYHMHADDHQGGAYIEAERQQVKHVAVQTGALDSGGGDIHTELDLKNFLAMPELVSETVGMTKRMIARGGLDITHSSLLY